jgi:hypothetical protein
MQFIPAETDDDSVFTTVHPVAFDDTEKQEVVVEMGYWFSLILEHHSDLTYSQVLGVMRKQREYFELDLLEGDGLTTLEGIVDLVRNPIVVPPGRDADADIDALARAMENRAE